MLRAFSEEVMISAQRICPPIVWFFSGSGSPLSKDQARPSEMRGVDIPLQTAWDGAGQRAKESKVSFRPHARLALAGR
jgi:hypothetical protein